MTTDTVNAERHSSPSEQTGQSGPIKNIQLVQTATAEQHKEHRYGSWMPRTVWALTSRSWVPLAVYSFVIEHRDGLVLFDTGVDPAVGLDPNYISSPIGRFLLHRIFRFEIREEDALRYQLQKLGVSVGDVRKAVISHLHFDHVGGIADIPNAELIVSDAEWAMMSEPHPEYEWMLREHIQIPGANWRPISFSPTDDTLFARFGGAYDVMGDGSMMMIPTPGHTVGSSSLLLRSGGMPPVLLIGDLAYQADLLLSDQVPGTGDARVLRETYAKVRALKDDLPDMIIIASHDLKAGELLNQATAGLRQ